MYGPPMDEKIIDDMDNFDYNCDQYNQYNQYDLCEPEKNIKNEYNNDNNDNTMLLRDKEIMELKSKIVELNKLLIQKNNELKENRIKNDNQLIKINKTFDNHINEYQRLVQNYSSMQQELTNLQKEIKNKNQIIMQLQNNKNNIINEQDTNLILAINKKIKNIYQIFFDKGNNIFNEHIFLKSDKDNQIKLLMRNIDMFSQELISYKNKDYNYNKKYRNNLQNNNFNNNTNNIDPQFYLKFIDIIKTFCNNLSNNINNFNNLPNYSIKDKNDKKYKDILITIKALTDYIISNENNVNNFNTNNNINNNNQYIELKKRLNEMSDLLVKSNEYLNKSRQDNYELKQKYYELEKKYNLNIKDISSIDNNNKDKEKDNYKLLNELNNKNQQIKSLEHMITRLTDKRNNTNTSNTIYNNNRSMLTDTSYYGKIVNKKLYNEIKSQNQSKNSFYLNNKFIKDEKNEKSLRNFLDKYTNGEYGNASKINETNNSNGKVIINLKDEIENLNKGITNELSYDDEIDNYQNYNEEEEDLKKSQIEGNNNE